MHETIQRRRKQLRWATERQWNWENVKGKRLINVLILVLVILRWTAERLRLQWPQPASNMVRNPTWSDGASKIINIVLYDLPHIEIVADEKTKKEERNTIAEEKETQTNEDWRTNERTTRIKTQTIHSVRFIRVLLSFFGRQPNALQPCEWTTKIICIPWCGAALRMSSPKHRTYVQMLLSSPTKNSCVVCSVRRESDTEMSNTALSLSLSWHTHTHSQSLGCVWVCFRKIHAFAVSSQPVLVHNISEVNWKTVSVNSLSAHIHNGRREHTFSFGSTFERSRRLQPERKIPKRKICRSSVFCENFWRKLRKKKLELNREVKWNRRQKKQFRLTVNEISPIWWAIDKLKR